MRKLDWKWMTAGLVAIVAATGMNIHAQSMATEQTMAGINLSLDKYTDMVLAEREMDETVHEIPVNAESTVATEGAVSDDGTTDKEEKTDKKDKKPAKEQEDKDDTSHLKLNLVYDRLGVAKVDSYLNVRSKPSKSAKIVGKMTKNAGCHIYYIKKGWAKIVSGQVRGYVKASYLVTDQKAEELARKVANLRVEVNTETLNVRYLPSTDARIYDQISKEDEYDIVKRGLTEEWMDNYISKHCKKSDLKGINRKEMYQDLDNWMCISIDDEKAFVSGDFVKVTYNLDRAVKLNADGSTASNGSSGGSSILSDIVNYAMQFLGNRYVWGGTSLTNGTDCSGFTMRIYEHFGYSIPRVSSAQAAALPSVDRGSVRPGDLFFYGSGGVSHVGMYIGNNQIIHASNERTGIKISYAYYRTPIKIGRVIR